LCIVVVVVVVVVVGACVERTYNLRMPYVRMYKVGGRYIYCQPFGVDGTYTVNPFGVDSTYTVNPVPPPPQQLLARNNNKDFARILPGVLRLMAEKVAESVVFYVVL